MEISTLKDFDIRQLIEFNERIYPEKANLDISKYIGFWLSRSSDANDFIMIMKDGDKIVGQGFQSKMSYYYNDTLYDSLWGFDLMVDPCYRKQNWGVDLMLQLKKSFPNSFATGSNPTALKLNLKLGAGYIGDVHKYVGITNPFWVISSVFRGEIAGNKFPQKVTVKSTTFYLMAKDELPDLNKPFNKDLLEIARDKEYLMWRFFNKLHDYAVYVDKNTNNYFVLRTIVKKHITAMVLVDFRCDLSSSTEMELIFKAAKKITNKLKLSILICGSSLSMIDMVFEKRHFTAVGRHRPIICSVKFNDHRDKIDSRNFTLLTLADSDGETIW